MLRRIWNPVKSLRWSIFVKIVNGLLFSQINSIINVQLGSKFASVAFLWMGFNCLKATEPLREDSLLFTTQFSEVLGTH